MVEEERKALVVMGLKSPPAPPLRGVNSNREMDDCIARKSFLAFLMELLKILISPCL